MSTLTTPRPQSPSAPRPPADPVTSRRARWVSSWRIALRMAVRDTRRYKGRSALVLVMVSIPVGLLVALAVFATSASTGAADRIPQSLGTAQALLGGPEPYRIAQGADPDMMMSSSGSDPARPIPGFDPGASLGSDTNVSAVGNLVGGEVVRSGELSLRHPIGERSRTVTVMVLDGAKGLGSKATLTAGRWAAAQDEVVVTPYGVDRGMPTSGTTTLVSQGREHTVTVVGQAEVFNSWGGMPDAVSAQPVVSDALYQWQWLVLRDTPVDYAEVRDLNAYGLRVTSAAVLRNPPADSELPPELQGISYSADQELRVVIALGGLMLVIVTTLLVAPAFAVSASRQRRTLALAASNGAETRQLRRKVLAQAIVLGATGAVVVAALTILGVWVGIQIWSSRRPWSDFRHFDVEPWSIVAIVGCAILASVVAALVPASRLGRLDIVGVMRGQSASPPVNKVLPVIGLVLALGGGAGLIGSVATKQRELPIVASGLALTLGALLLVPVLLVLAGRLASRLPVAPRMATRDAARHRTRSGPTVAAIMAGTIALTMFSISLASDTKSQAKEYRPQLPAGLGYVSVNSYDPSTGQPTDPQADVVEGVLDRSAPHLERTPVRTVAQGFGTDPTKPVPFLVAVPQGCTTTRAVMDNEPSPDGRPACMKLGTQGSLQAAALPLDAIATTTGLEGADLQRVASGGIVVTDPTVLRGGRVQLDSGTFTQDQQTGAVDPTVERSVQVDAVVRDFNLSGLNVGGLVTTETAQRLGWDTTVTTFLLRDPDGAVSQADEESLGELLGEDGYVYVERGFQRDDATVMAIMFGGFGLLLLIVTLISTALALAEQQSDMGTFAAIGATRATRRRLAAAQALVVGLIGVALGIGVGIVPGIALTYPLTTQSWDPDTGVERVVDPTIVIPWLPLTAIVVGVPLVAALLSAAAIRRAPAMTRRAD